MTRLKISGRRLKNKRPGAFQEHRGVLLGIKLALKQAKLAKLHYQPQHLTDAQRPAAQANRDVVGYVQRKI